jgi:hypothetical protein
MERFLSGLVRLSTGLLPYANQMPSIEIYLPEAESRHYSPITPSLATQSMLVVLSISQKDYIHYITEHLDFNFA